MEQFHLDKPFSCGPVQIHKFPTHKIGHPCIPFEVHIATQVSFYFSLQEYPVSKFSSNI